MRFTFYVNNHSRTQITMTSELLHMIHRISTLVPPINHTQSTLTNSLSLSVDSIKMILTHTWYL